MCSNIVESAVMVGSAKGTRGWMEIDAAHVVYDHPFHAPLEHAVSIDFVDTHGEPGDRVAVELSAASARELALRIVAALEKGEALTHPISG